MKTFAIVATLALAAAPFAILAAEPAPPQPEATATPCPAMPQHQIGAMQGHQMHGDGTMQRPMPMQGQMQGHQMQGHQMQGQMQGGMSGGGHGAMMGQGQGAMTGPMGMSGGAMPCQASPTPQPSASPDGN